MKLSRNWVGGFGLATLTSIIGVVACSGGDDPQPQPAPPAGGAPPVGGTPSFGGSSAGTPTVIAGGGTGGSAGSVSVAGSAGAATGGSGGTAAAGAPGFACDAKAFNCAKITSFGVPNEAGFGYGDFQGGVSVFGGLTRVVDEVDRIHVKGKVDNYGRGFNIWFNYCTDFTDVTGVTFTLSGNNTSAGAVAPPAGGSGGASAGDGGTGGSSAGEGGASGGSGGAATAPKALKIDFQVQTNSNYPWQPFQDDPNNKKGACTIPDDDFQANKDAVWSACVPSSKDGIPVSATPTPVSITFATDLKGGKPNPWSEASIHEIVGLQWQFPWSKGNDYEIDVTVDDVTFISATQTADCPVVGGAAGGAGGTGGGGASGGESGGSGGASAGTGGASAGTAGG